MGTGFESLWDGSAPLGRAEVVYHTSSRLRIRSTPQATKASVLEFKKRVSELENHPLHRLWPAVSGEGLVLEDLENRDAWRISGEAKRCGLSVEWTATDIGRMSFFDGFGTAVTVPPALRYEVLDLMVKAGCRIDEMAVD